MIDHSWKGVEKYEQNQQHIHCIVNNCHYGQTATSAQLMKYW